MLLKNDKMAKQKETPKMTAGRAVLIELIQRYLKGLLDPSISLLEVHKLLYFMQEAGRAITLKIPESALWSLCAKLASCTKRS